MMKLGLFVEGTGHHVAAWRDPDVDAHGRQTLKQYVDIARLAERGKFDLLFMADTNATFGPDDVETWTRTTQASRLEPITPSGTPSSSITSEIRLVHSPSARNRSTAPAGGFGVDCILMRSAAIRPVSFFSGMVFPLRGCSPD